MNHTQKTWWGVNVVYRCYDGDGRLLYIGTSHNAPARLGAHKRESWWWSLVTRTRITVHPNLEVAYAVEQEAIREENPAFNVRRAGMPDFLTRGHWTPEDHALHRRWNREYGKRLMNGRRLRLIS